MNKRTFASTVIGYVDPVALDFEFGEIPGPLSVYDTIEELAKDNPCVRDSLSGIDNTCLPRLVTITYTYELDVDEHGDPVNSTRDLSGFLGKD